MHPESFSADRIQNESQPLSYWEDFARRIAKDPSQALFLADEGEQLVGMCGIRRGTSAKTEHGAMVWGVYVRAAARGQQVGARLIGAALEWARREQVRLVKLAVVTSNLPAIRLYHRSGFTVYGVEPEAIITGQNSYDELLMVRRL